MPDELEQYELHHRARIAIKPGITGMWQVSGRSDITDFEEIVRLDTEYISQKNTFHSQWSEQAGNPAGETDHREIWICLGSFHLTILYHV